MLKKILMFLERIFKRKRNEKALDSWKDIEYNGKLEEFKKEIKFDNGEEGEKLIKEILESKNSILEESENIVPLKEKMLEYINVLIRKVDKCQNDIETIKIGQKLNN